MLFCCFWVFPGKSIPFSGQLIFKEKNDSEKSDPILLSNAISLFRFLCLPFCKLAGNGFFRPFVTPKCNWLNFQMEEQNQRGKFNFNLVLIRPPYLCDPVQPSCLVTFLNIKPTVFSFLWFTLLQILKHFLFGFCRSWTLWF